MNKNYIQLYTYEEAGSVYLQKNTFTPDPRLIMQTYIYDGKMETCDELLLFELDYVVQKEKYATLSRSIDKHFDKLPSSGDNSRRLIIEYENTKLVKQAPPDQDLLFERLYDKFTRIVSYSSIPSG
ncbi:MAG: hypothetical protein GX079_06450 [Tissierellia bacterium]|nr:hypothetical protein [Tissierellia bacterium]